jgi:hypothetical protein
MTKDDDARGTANTTEGQTAQYQNSSCQKILEDNASQLETDGTLTLKVQPITAWCTIKQRGN